MSHERSAPSSAAAIMKSCYLFLVLSVAVVSSKVIDINWAVDLGLAKTNHYLRQHRLTNIHIPQGSFGSHVSFSDSDVLGLDSLKRTGNCTIEVAGENSTFNYHYGLGFFQQSFKYLKINDQGMSASYRIRDNSAHLRYTVHNIGQKTGSCFVTVHEMSYERLAKIDFHASRPEYDGIDLEEYFGKEIVPFLNSKIDKGSVEEVWQEFLCQQPHLQISENMSLIHRTILEQIGFPSQQ